MNQRKIYVVGGDFPYANWMQGKLTNTMEEADLVVFTGGEDVTPALYGEKSHRTTGNNPDRDSEEIAEFVKAKSLGKHVIGICRGSQFICVMAGGKLVQHMANKYSQHPIRLKDGSSIKITSTHHQAAFPFNLKEEEYDIIGWGEGLSDYHQGVDETDELSKHPLFKEVEIAYYPDIKALGIQGHPEYSYQDKEGLAYCQTLLDNFLNDKL